VLEVITRLLVDQFQLFLVQMRGNGHLFVVLEGCYEMFIFKVFVRVLSGKGSILEGSETEIDRYVDGEKGQLFLDEKPFIWVPGSRFPVFKPRWRSWFSHIIKGCEGHFDGGLEGANFSLLTLDIYPLP
jgi:hypothetical protein